MKCIDCKYSHKGDDVDSYMHCRRNPPTNDEHKPWPGIRPIDWCGEYAPSQPPILMMSHCEAMELIQKERVAINPSITIDIRTAKDMLEAFDEHCRYYDYSLLTSVFNEIESLVKKAEANARTSQPKPTQDPIT